jgi:hypothetical protein
MDIHLVLAIVSVALTLASVIPYTRDIFHGTTRPNTVTWFLWLFIQTIAIAAQIHEGASWSLAFVLADGVTILFVFALSLSRYGYRTYDWFDAGCGILGVAAIVAWLVTGSGIVALIFSVLADTFAALPTLRKAYTDPWSEHPTGWALTASGGLVSLFATTQFNTANVLFPLYLVVINALTFSLTFIGRKTHAKPNDAAKI